MSKQQQTTTNPRILVAMKSSVAAGKVHGIWIDATKPLKAITVEINKFLTDYPEEAKEGTVINRYEGFHGIKIERNLASISSIAQSLVNYGDPFIAYLELFRPNKDKKDFHDIAKDFIRKHIPAKKFHLSQTTLPWFIYAIITHISATIQGQRFARHKNTVYFFHSK